MNLNPLFKNAIKKGAQVTNYQTVRWLRPRKPFWLGLAKSKMFVVKEEKEIMTPDEKEVYNTLVAKYNTEYDSLLNFIRDDSPKWKNIAQSDEEENKKVSPELQEMIASSFKMNEEWSAESRRLGERWTEKYLEAEAEKALALAEEENLKKLKDQEMVDEIIRKEKALSATYITPENLDEAIEECLKNVEEFDFAIDLNGNKYFGREPLEKQAKPVEADESVVLAERSKPKSQFVPEHQ